MTRYQILRGAQNSHKQSPQGWSDRPWGFVCETPADPNISS